jgi:hypothetical protein
MKRLLVLGVLLIIGAFAVDAIGDATQTRDDKRDTDKKTEIVFHVEGKHFRQSLDVAAQALFGKCAATVGGHLVDPGIEPIGPGDYRFAMTPTLGDHGRERLLGCMNDLSIERLRSHVESVHDVPLGVAA